MSDTPPWSQFELQIYLWQTRKKTPNPEVYKQAFLEITSRQQNHVQIFTDGSKVDEKVATAALSSVAQNSPFSCWLRDHRSILFALKQAYQSQERKFVIFSDSLSTSQTLRKWKTDHHLLIQIQDLLHKINADQNEIVSIYGFLYMLVFEEMRFADRAAKEAFHKKTDSRSHAFFGPKTFNC